MTTSQVADEAILKDFRQRLKRQYSEDPQFVEVHPNPRTTDGVYEFTVNLKPEQQIRCFYWRFEQNVSNGQLAMDVATKPTDTPDSIVAGWMASRKIKDVRDKPAPKSRKKS